VVVVVAVVQQLERMGWVLLAQQLEQQLERMGLVLLAPLAPQLGRLWCMEPGRGPDRWPSTRECGATLLSQQLLQTGNERFEK
jgi:hypothetical protein